MDENGSVYIYIYIYIYMIKYYPAIKRITFESVLMRWMKLEPIVQSEVRKKNTKTVY